MKIHKNHAIYVNIAKLQNRNLLFFKNYYNFLPLEINELIIIKIIWEIRFLYYFFFNRIESRDTSLVIRTFATPRCINLWEKAVGRNADFAS